MCLPAQEVFDNGGDLRRDAIVHVWKGGYEFQKEAAAVTAAGVLHYIM
jgi:hypothetical protein